MYEQVTVLKVKFVLPILFNKNLPLIFRINLSTLIKQWLFLNNGLRHHDIRSCFLRNLKWPIKTNYQYMKPNTKIFKKPCTTKERHNFVITHRRLNGINPLNDIQKIYLKTKMSGLKYESSLNISLTILMIPQQNIKKYYYIHVLYNKTFKTY